MIKRFALYLWSNVITYLKTIQNGMKNCANLMTIANLIDYCAAALKFLCY